MATSITLFRTMDVNDEWQERRQKVENDAARVSDDEILTSDLDIISERLAIPYHFDVPEVSYDQLSADPPSFPRGSDQGEIVWCIPVTGDGAILGFYHRNQPLDPQYRATVSDGMVEIRTRVFRNRIQDARREIGTAIDQIKQYLPPVQSILREYNKRFAQFAKSVMERRKGELLANERAIENFVSLGIPIRKRNDEVAQVFVPVQRKVIAIPDCPKELEQNPFIQQRAYEDILQTINAMAHGIERSPGVFIGMKEEDIRMILLIGLNAVYEGKASGETFNGIGKTDILIRAGDSNVFLAECAIWDGEDYLLRKLGQLFGYAMWRDSKTALIMFNRTRNLTRVVEIMRTALAAHPQCVRQIDPTTETSSRYIFHRHDDPDRLFTLAALAFDVPQ